MEAMIRAMEGKTEADLDDRFKRDLDNFVLCASFTLSPCRLGLCPPLQGPARR
jgi:hypothetical protein